MEKRSTLAGLLGTGRLAASTINLLSTEMLAPPWFVPRLNGSGKGTPLSKGSRSSGRLAQVNSSLRVVVMSPLALVLEVRVKKSSVPSGESMGRYSSSSQLTSGMGDGSGPPACMWN